MFRSVLASRWRQASPQRPGEQHRHRARGITAAICAAVAAGIALTTAGLAGAAVPAAAATRSLRPPEYSSAWVGYQTGGRWFRYVSTTVTVPPQVVPPSPGAPSQRGDAMIWLYGIGSVVPTQITVAPGGGPVSWGDPGGSGTFRVSPRIGDRLTLSIYYDQHGHVYLTATDSTRHTTQTVRTNVPKMTYLTARLFAWVYNDVPPPLADTPLWQFTNSRMTTYNGDHGTVLGPWTTSKMIVTSDGTSPGPVVASPSGLSNGGRDFSVWLRALPKACATAGLVVWAYADYGGGYAGGYAYTLGFTNLSGHACTLRGHPGVSAVSLAGQQLGSPAGRGGGTPATVTLASGATATARLDIGDAGAWCQPVTAAGLRVYPPGQRAAKIVPIPFGACPHAGPVWMGVGPVQNTGPDQPAATAR
jgi:hypothetical protein